jgi:hypothetical protein
MTGLDVDKADIGMCKFNQAEIMVNQTLCKAIVHCVKPPSLYKTRGPVKKTCPKQYNTIRI